MSERDLSQARIKPGYVLDPNEIVEPTMSDLDWVDFESGISFFNAQKFWESHEAWENVWKRHAESSRVFFQALIQLAAAYHQLRRGISHGVLKHFRNSATKLSPFPNRFLGLELRLIKSALEDGEAEALRLGSDLARFDEELIVQLVFDRPKS